MRIGIDIGGTKAVVAAVDENRRILQKVRISTGDGADCKSIVTLAAETAVQLAGGKENLTSVGIGIPGTVDETGKIAVYAPNIKWFDEPVAHYFEQVAGCSPFLAQDTRAAAWGEANYGEMASKSCVVCVTLGTGIGCGIVMNHRIYHGSFGTAGEIGHIPVANNGRRCNCGQYDCMESYASGLGLARTAHESGLCDTAEQLFELAKQGNQSARAIIAQGVEYCSNVMVAIVNLLSPDAILFSGGLSRQKEWYLDPLMEAVRRKAYQKAVSGGFYMGPAFLGSDAPVIGAAFLNEAF